MQRLIQSLSLALALSVPTAAMAIQAPSAPITDPQVFVNTAGPANEFEIESSQLALKQTKTPAILTFARRMIADHGAAAKKMATAAKAQGVSVPAGLDPPGKENMQQLSPLKGKAFDSAYVSMQVMAHDQAVALFKGYSTNGKPGALKSFAAATLPTLQSHQRMIHSIAGK